jgi:hypothetical protein
MKATLSALLLAASLTLASCGEDTSSPYLEFAGGGFIFNYRNAEAFYGFVARPLRTLPEDAVIEARFDMPGGAQPFVATEKVIPGQLQYSFKTPFLTGIEKDHEYKAVIRLIDPKGQELARYERSFHTDVDQATLPSQPLVVGPGYEPNPELQKNAN